MEQYLVNVPVKINIWIRTECLKQQFEVIKKVRPSILFVFSDGGRTDAEWKAIHLNRKLIDEGIDWDCQVIRMYEDRNLGMYAMIKKDFDIIWPQVDRCIILEDDQIPSVSFFAYCAELLEKYKDDQRVECICGMNHLGVSDNVNADYFFSRQGSIWGIATWKRVVEGWNSFEYGRDSYIMKLLRHRTQHNKIAWKRICAYTQQEKYEGHVAAYEFWIEFDMYSQNRLQIIPKYNQICNAGATSDSEHAGDLCQLPRGIRKIFNNKTYELSFPLTHPQYVIPDVEYEKKRNQIMGYNTPCRAIIRKIERVWLMLIHGNAKGIAQRIMRKRMGEN